MDGATFVRAELLAGGRNKKVGINWSGRPVAPLIEAHSVCRGSAYETRFADADGRANGVDKALIDAVVANPRRQISRRYCGSADKWWLWILCRPLTLRGGSVRGNQKRQKRKQAQHVTPLGWLRGYGPLKGGPNRNVTRNRDLLRQFPACQKSGLGVFSGQASGRFTSGPIELDFFAPAQAMVDEVLKAVPSLFALDRGLDWTRLR